MIYTEMKIPPLVMPKSVQPIEALISLTPLVVP